MPFCKHKCAYCDFYSVTDETLIKRYCKAVRLQLEDYSPSAEECEISTVFIGGGTPSVVPRKQIIEIINSIYDNFNVIDDAEFTIEVNPASADLHTLRSYRKNGVNRLSIGMQSAIGSELKTLGRIHDYDDFEQCFTDARKAKFDNINVDIIYGIPGQTLSTLMETIEKVCELGPEHVSLYCLTLEEGTSMYDMVKNGELELPDEDMEFRMYSTAIDALTEAGYVQYEISNFAVPGYECKHNLKYWNCEEYLGIGPGAHSYFNNCRYSFKRDIAEYIDTLENTDNSDYIVDENYEIKPEERMNEYIMLKLRLKEGLDTDEFFDRFGKTFESLYDKYLSQYLKYGYMEKADGHFRFTTKGMYVSNFILSAMLEFEGNIEKGMAKGSEI